MTYESPYRVERIVRPGAHYDLTYYAITRTGEDVLVSGNDPVFMHRVCDLLNEQENGKDVHR